LAEAQLNFGQLRCCKIFSRRQQRMSFMTDLCTAGAHLFLT
jgi:hypothetical protein